MKTIIYIDVKITTDFDRSSDTENGSETGARILKNKVGSSVEEAPEKDSADIT